MGFGTDFEINIFLNKQKYRTKEKVKEKIKGLEDYMYSVKCKLKMFASSNLSETVPKDWNDEPINWLNKEVEELLEELYEDSIEVYKLNLYIEYLDEHNITDIKQD